MNIIFTMKIIDDIDHTMIIKTTEAELEEQQEAIKKQAIAQYKKAKEEAERKKKLLPPPKFYYDVKVECMLPAVLTYRVHAETPEQAAEMIKGLSPNTVKHKLIGRKELKLMVYDAGSSMIRIIKNILR
jgi:hypothetical protein